jgi:UDP-N-acetyl-D-glucosamine/UDP-N-acetyl-D-galactosamine dehydrogenase
VNLKNKIIAVIGLGYVGLPLAVEFGRLRPVIGFDIDNTRVKKLLRGVDDTNEVSDEELRAAGHLSFTCDSSALESASVFIVTVPTPTDSANRPDFKPLMMACETVGAVLKSGDVVILESTVYPGATEEVCVPILERVSGLRYLTSDDVHGAGFYCGYSPERINPGDKHHRLPVIKKVTSGSTPEAAQAIDGLYQEIIKAGTHLASSIRVAEAAKVIENSQRDLNIAFVNELSVIFNRMGIDTQEVLAAASTKWNFLPFKPGLVGGHCIGVDPYYLTHKAQELGYRPQVILAGRAINDNMGSYAARNVIRLMVKNRINVANATVGIMGVTFKENCPDTRNSKVVDIIRELKRWGLKVRITDPWANSNNLLNTYGLVLTELTDQDRVDSLIVAVAHDQFSLIKPAQLRSLCVPDGNPVIGDLKGIYKRRDLEYVGFTVFRL